MSRAKHSVFRAYKPGYIHIDVKYLPQMADEGRSRFLRDLERACPLRIRTILTDNGKEFTDRLFGLRKRAASGAHEFDTLCAAPNWPQTNGMVDPFNGRIEDVLQSHHFQSGEELETTLHRYV